MDNIRDVIIKRFPSIFDNAFTDLELVRKLVNALNECIDQSNSVTENVKSLRNWFNNLDVSEEVNIKLDEMEQDGTLAQIINVQLLGDLNNEIQAIETKISNAAHNGTFKKENKTGFIDTTNYTVSQYYGLYDSLVNSSRFGYVDLGKDQSGNYDIRMYRYIPTNFNRTILVVCSLHGWEHYGAYQMYEIFKTLLNDKDLPTQYKELRATRILCIPVANPWGLMADSHQGEGAVRRGNSRSVDLNRNFDWNWSTGLVDFGLNSGTEPFSEAETSHIRKVMYDYNITSFIDVHSFNAQPGETRDYLFYGNENIKQNTYQFINWLSANYPNINIQHTLSENDATSNNYANRVLNIPSINIELIKGKGDHNKWYEVLINYLNFMSMSYNNEFNGVTNNAKFFHAYPQNSVADVVPATWTNYAPFTYSWKVTKNSLLMVTGFMDIEISGGDSTTAFTFSPYAMQDNYYVNQAVDNRSKPYVKASSGVVHVPFTYYMPCVNGRGDVTFKMDIIKEGSGTITIKRRDMQIMTIPAYFHTVELNQHTKVSV